MSYYTRAVSDLIDELSRLPGIGTKTAQRLAFFILKATRERAQTLADAIIEVKDKVRFCDACFNLTESALCRFCSDPGRDQSVICVVEDPFDVIAIEKTGWFKGLYHVLQGSISPIDGRGPGQLKLEELVARVKAKGVEEVIAATNPDIEGETTAMYVAKILKPFDVRVTRLASGLPVGSDLEYADEVTLGRALEGRKEM